MKTVVTTKSGSVYTFDKEQMTWERNNLDRDIIGLEGVNDGTLDVFPDPIVVDYSMFIFADGNRITTTPVISIEERD